DVDAMMARLKQVAAEVGLPFGDRKKTYNSRLAQELGKWAESKGKGDEFHAAVFRAYFVDGKNIGKIPVLAELAESVGLPGKEAQEVLEARTFEEAVDSDWARAYALGVTGVPTFVINGYGAVGAQPYKILERLVRTANVKKRQPDE
ncbi:MAG: DsbA family protein, partial [Nitrospira sp.]|nr:DsbA family protein [Nitrospira sp.]